MLLFYYAIVALRAMRSWNPTKLQLLLNVGMFYGPDDRGAIKMQFLDVKQDPSRPSFRRFPDKGGGDLARNTSVPFPPRWSWHPLESALARMSWHSECRPRAPDCGKEYCFYLVSKRMTWH